VDRAADRAVDDILGRDISGRDLILIGGGLFLLGKAVYEIHDKLEGSEHGPGKAAASFASVITQVMVLDIVFSLDSVITAIGMADDLRSWSPRWCWPCW
jgi:predicted tellurium resistance membrane protein TerC